MACIFCLKGCGSCCSAKEQYSQVGTSQLHCTPTLKGERVNSGMDCVLTNCTLLLWIVLPRCSTTVLRSQLPKQITTSHNHQKAFRENGGNLSSANVNSLLDN